jgi:hypothetical protein
MKEKTSFIPLSVRTDLFLYHIVATATVMWVLTTDLAFNQGKNDVLGRVRFILAVQLLIGCC